MSVINITNVAIINNPDLFSSPFQIQISFECLQDLQDTIEWKVIYVGSANDENYDQILDQFSIGPLATGAMQFQIETQGPDFTKIPTKDDILGVTAVIITVTYKNQEFFRCGYYIYNGYQDAELLENDPQEVQIQKVYRNVLVDKPRITRFNVDWGFTNQNALMIEQITQGIIQNDQQQQQPYNYAQNMFNQNETNIF